MRTLTSDMKRKKIQTAPSLWVQGIKPMWSCIPAISFIAYKVEKTYLSNTLQQVAGHLVILLLFTSG